ncbi:MAG: MaoC family dehydratase [Burkholderiales bacterium]|nr:MAG: MaoC family dehydratase [Burkholderiales bacterium]
MSAAVPGRGAAGAGFAAPIDDRWFEDYAPGSVHDLGTIAVDEAEVVAFASRYDPQPFHVDAQAAAESPFGGLIASGWHTAALMMRLFVDRYMSHVASLSSPGIDAMRWLRPVRPGDTLAVRITVAEARVSKSKPDRGIVTSDIEVSNQNGEPVMTMRAYNLVACRPVG